MRQNEPEWVTMTHNKSKSNQQNEPHWVTMIYKRHKKLQLAKMRHSDAHLSNISQKYLEWVTKSYYELQGDAMSYSE